VVRGIPHIKDENGFTIAVETATVPI